MSLIGIDALVGVDVDSAQKTVKEAAPGVIDAFFSLFKKAKKYDEMTMDERVKATSEEQKDWTAEQKAAVAEEKKLRADKARAARAADEDSFFTKHIVGPIKIWHALTGGLLAAVGGGVYYWTTRKK